MNEQFIDEVMGLVQILCGKSYAAGVAEMLERVDASNKLDGEITQVEKAIRSKLREVVTPKEMNDGEIIAAYESLSEAKRNLFLSRIGLTCSRCNTGTYKADSNGYNDFHRCDACRHVPMWYEDGTEFFHNNIGAK